MISILPYSETAKETVFSRVVPEVDVTGAVKEIIANVEEQIKRSGLERKELTAGVVVVGNAAKLRGWLELLEERLGGMKVRVGALRKDIQAVEKERSQVNDYMQAVGLLYAAKEDCTKTPFQEKPVEPEKPVIEEEEEEEIVITVDKEPAEEKKPKRKNIFTALFDKFGQMIEEGENDDEE